MATTATEESSSKKLYKIIFFVPEAQKEQVKERLFSIGAGKFGKYDQCAFESSGYGQFRPLEGSNPFIGNANKLERLVEYKVEMVCQEELIKQAIKELIDAHPYEEPAYEVYEIKTFQ